METKQTEQTDFQLFIAHCESHEQDYIIMNDEFYIYNEFFDTTRILFPFDLVTSECLTQS